MILKSLSSSSRGNIHILENDDTTLLLDCGVKFNCLVKELNSIKIDGVLITHEHGDHIGGCKTLAENKKTVYYGTEETLHKIEVPLFLKCAIQPFKTFKIGSFSIVAFEVRHDAIHPVNYLIRDNTTGANLLYITDTGYIDNLKFKDIDYFLIECNFDEEWFNKEELTVTEQIKEKRLFSDIGHLSIQKTIQFLKRTMNHNTKKIILCHISYSFDEYKEFEKRVKEELHFENVIALNPRNIGQVQIILKEKKEVMPFE